MTEYSDNRADTSGWEEQLYPDAADDEESVEGPTTE
jgi:hypothetical protein